MSQFPKNLDPQAIQQLTNLVLKGDLDAGRNALALYALSGFALGQVFPTANIGLAQQATPQMMADFHQVLTTAITNGQGLTEEHLTTFGPVLTLVLSAAIKALIERLLNNVIKDGVIPQGNLHQTVAG